MIFLLRCLLGHYRRHPVQALFLLAGIIMANVLLVGTQAINAQSRASYAEGEQLLGAGPQGRIRMADGSDAIDERLYLKLRLAGFHELAPLLRRIVIDRNGKPLEILGLDGLAMPRPTGQGRERLQEQEDGGDYGAFSFPPYELWGAPARLRQLALVSGQQLALADGSTLPPARQAPDQSLGHRLVMDIGALQTLTDSAGLISAMLAFDLAPGRLEALRAALPPELVWVPADEQPDAAALTASFHLNLAAMGLLAFVVGLFLVYNALAFSYTDRRVLLRRLRLAGIARRELAQALLLELGLFLAIGAAIGTWLGALLAAWLLPGVGQTLAQLYGVYIQYPDSLAPGGWWLPLLMTLAAAVLCAAFPLRATLAQPLLDRGASGWSLAETARRDRGLGLAGALLLAMALALAAIASNVLLALAGMACLLLGAALLLPLVLRTLLSLLAHLVPARYAALGWLLADTRWLLGPASLALMAVTLALVANSGLNIMTGSFRAATDQWLAQRLTAELYVRGSPDTAAITAWLEREAPDARIAERYALTVVQPAPNAEGVRVEVVDLPDVGPFTASIELLTAGTDAFSAFQGGRGVLISERAWRLDGWRVGDMLQVCAAIEPLPVVGVYYDYGNPLSQWMVAPAAHRTCWPDLEPAGRAIFGPNSLDWQSLAAQLSSAFDLDEGDLIEQGALRAVGLAVFDRTFAVTRALNLLTLLVAGVGIFCAISAIHHHRVGQQALLASLGLGRWLRGGLLLLQWGVLGLFAMALVWPCGALLGAYLAGVVTPIAFGWSFPLLVEPAPLLALAGTAVTCLVLAVALPSLRLLRSTPGDLLRWESV